MAYATPSERHAHWPDLMVIGTGAVVFVSGISMVTTWLWIMGVALTLLGFGGLCGYRFVSWGYLVLGITLMLVGAWRINLLGFSWARTAIAGAGLACVGLAILGVARRGRRRKRRDVPPVSLVILQRAPRFLDDHLLTVMVGSAWNLDFPLDEHSSSPFVTSEGRSLRVKSDDGTFVVRCVDRPYWKRPDEVALFLNDVRAQRAMREHLSWISVDYVGQAAGEARTHLYAQIARLLAEIADSDTLAILQPETGSFRVWDHSVAEILRSYSPLDCFSISNVAPVVQVSSDDPLMVSAIAEARERWPEFTRVFATRHPEQHFSVKAPITRDGQTEHIWVDVTSITSEYVRGKLGNAPIDLQGLELGDPVSIPISSIEDWIYVLTDQPVGGFTIPAVTSASTRAHKTR